MQELLTVITILLALGYLIWKLKVRFSKKSSSCDGCAIHESAKVDKPPPVSPS